MNYELLGKLAMEETKELKNEKSLLLKRNEILHHEVDTLKSIIKKLEEEKAFLENEVSSLKDALKFKKNEGEYVSRYS